MSERALALSLVALAGARGRRVLFRGLSATFRGGEVVHVVGKNGVGKTTLLRTIAGLTPPASGEVRFCGVPIGKEESDWRGAFWYIGHLPAVHESLSARENLTFLATVTGGGARGDVERALTAAGLGRVADLPAGTLSAGQRRRVALARLFLPSPPPVWLLDEPLTALDSGFAARVVEQIENHAARGGLVVLTTHQEAPFSRGVVAFDLATFAREGGREG
ncbi:MAG: cytochrome c biogenesis heme-transporting ATPase CcmA [Hydrogenophilus sp.]|nr:cytochrome c biogenesis heme-transporting ATPase CcmA [Hydrogenophilus sp.]